MFPLLLLLRAPSADEPVDEEPATDEAAESDSDVASPDSEVKKLKKDLSERGLLGLDSLIIRIN